MEAGVRLPARDDAFYQADMVIGCTPLAADSVTVPEPVAIVEVLSPTTAAHDRGTKVPDYRALKSVQEILLVSSTREKAEVWRRKGDDWTVTDLEGRDALLRLDSIGVEVPLASVYEGVVFDPATAETASEAGQG